MAARGNECNLFQDLKEIVGSYIFFPVKSTEARIFPCVHVLCTSCGEMISSRFCKKSGDMMRCSVCELEFEIPSTEELREHKAMSELLSDFSKAANDSKHFCQNCLQDNSWRWKEMHSRTASTYCTACNKYACYQCSDKCNTCHQNIENISHLKENPTSFKICVNHKWHNKQLEIFCILCGRADCFLRLVGKVPIEIEEDFNRVIGHEINLLKNLSDEYSAIKTREEKEAKQFDSSIKELEKQIEEEHEEQVRALIDHKKLLLDQLRSIASQVDEDFGKRNNIIDTLLKTAERCKRSCESNQSTRKPDEKFCTLGAVRNKVDELKTELNSWKVFTLPSVSHEPPSLEIFFKTNVIQVDWKDQQQINDAIVDTDSKTKEYETTNTMVRNLPESGQGLSSTQCPSKRSNNASATFDMHIEKDQKYEDCENCDITFTASYKEMLEKMRNQIIPYKLRMRDKKRASLLKKDEVEAFRRHFDHAKRIPRDKWETAQWKSIEQCHEKLVKLSHAETEGPRFTKMLNEANDIIDDLLSKMAAIGKRPQQGLSNFGNTCYFNAVIQCLCATFPILEELCFNITLAEANQPLTEAFIQFLNNKCLGSSQQTDAYYSLFLTLCNSSPEFNNFRQHDSHDLFVHFLNDLRSEERHRIQSHRLNIDPRKILTAADKVFGGHFITIYTCLNCDQPYFVCESFLDISLPICFTQQKHPKYGRSGGRTGVGGDDQMWRRDCTPTGKGCKNTHCSDQGKEFTPPFLEALNQEQTIPADEGSEYRTRPVTLTECLRFYMAIERIPDGYLCLFCQDGNQAAATATAQTMPPATKRTLIYNPPAILVLHMKRFERTATGFTKCNDMVTYEEFLDLGPYCSSDCLRVDAKDKNVWYALYGIVVHMGSLDFGHYIAYVKVRECNPDATKTFRQTNFLDRDRVTTELKSNLGSSGKRADRKVEWKPKPATNRRWIYTSDSLTRDATSSEALNQEAFMLFYERIANYGD